MRFVRRFRVRRLIPSPSALLNARSLPRRLLLWLAFLEQRSFDATASLRILLQAVDDRPLHVEWNTPMKKPIMIIVSVATILFLSHLAESLGAQPFPPTQWSFAQQASQGPLFRTASQVDPSYPAVSYAAPSSFTGFQPNDTCGRCRNAWAGYCAEKAAECARRACRGHGCGRCGCQSCAEPCCGHAGCGLGVLRFLGVSCHAGCGCAHECACGDACSAGSDASSCANTEAEATDVLVAPEATDALSN
jgi:hypothetical protein